MIDKDETAYKSISEVAEILDLINKKNGKLLTHTIRFWEKEFKQVKPKIFTGRRRYYDQKTIDQLIYIKFLLKDKGMTIKGVKKLLNSDNSKLDPENKIFIKPKDILKSKLTKISNIIKELKK